MLVFSSAYNMNIITGAVQFIDLNPDASSFQRQFVGDVKRCEEIERMLRLTFKDALSSLIDFKLFRYIESEIVKEGVEIPEDDVNATPAPAPREITDLENSVATIEENLKEVSSNFVSLM